MSAQVLPGLMLKPDFARSINRSVRSVDRLIERGDVVVARMGPHVLIDVVATAERVKRGHAAERRGPELTEHLTD